MQRNLICFCKCDESKQQTTTSLFASGFSGSRVTDDRMELVSRASTALVDVADSEDPETSVSVRPRTRSVLIFSLRRLRCDPARDSLSTSCAPTCSADQTSSVSFAVDFVGPRRKQCGRLAGDRPRARGKGQGRVTTTTRKTSSRRFCASTSSDTRRKRSRPWCGT